MRDMSSKNGRSLQAAALRHSQPTAAAHTASGRLPAKHEVRAVFTTSDDPAVTRTITVDSSKGGSAQDLG